MRKQGSSRSYSYIVLLRKSAAVKLDFDNIDAALEELGLVEKAAVAPPAAASPTPKQSTAAKKKKKKKKKPAASATER